MQHDTKAHAARAVQSGGGPGKKLPDNDADGVRLRPPLHAACHVGRRKRVALGPAGSSRPVPACAIVHQHWSARALEVLHLNSSSVNTVWFIPPRSCARGADAALLRCSGLFRKTYKYLSALNEAMANYFSSNVYVPLIFIKSEL